MRWYEFLFIIFFVVACIVLTFGPAIFASQFSEWLNNVPGGVADAAYRKVLDLGGCFDDNPDTWCPDHRIEYAEHVDVGGDTIWCLTVVYWYYFDRKIESYIIVSQKEEELNVALQELGKTDACLK